MSEDRLYFRQLLAGRDFATDDDLAHSMANFAYAIGDRETGEAVLVDPAYRPLELIEVLEADGMTLTGVLGSHFHADHVGGSLMGTDIAGVKELFEADVHVPLHLHRDEVPWVLRTTGISETDIAAHDSGDTVMVGAIPITLLHTPGHTPGSQCFCVDGALVSGDTLFLDGCGRTDFPGSDPEQMYESLTYRLASIPDDWVLYPGHNYAEIPALAMGATRDRNVVFKPKSLQDWLRFFG
jgi:glyoxylase-like metal-dependent hydrolase (beta-lactamase superfamily II)